MHDDPSHLLMCSLGNSLGRSVPHLLAKGVIRLGDSIVAVVGNIIDDSEMALLDGAEKILWFGTPCHDLGKLGLQSRRDLVPLKGGDACDACTSEYHHTESDAFLVYGSHALLGGIALPLRRRPFTRFDFTDEWNNVGFGRIRTDGSIWAVAEGFCVSDAIELCAMKIRIAGTIQDAGTYMSLFDTPRKSILWCARPVGPLDSTEWTVIERFIADWRAEELACLPCLCGTPTGCSAIVTMRLDCDEEISSAKDLFEWYHAEQIPFSLAVKTTLLTPEHFPFLKEVARSGGTLLTHTHTHSANWGGSFEKAKAEAEISRQWFYELLPDVPTPILAVSPFHMNPPYAMQGAEAGGISGIVTGIIHNDPEYLLGRAGYAPFTDNLLTISQQSMLHGDSYAQQEQSVSIHAAGLDCQIAARGIWGYFDHPFSPTYQYGWKNSRERIEAHAKLVREIRSRPDVLCWSQGQCFQFLRSLMETVLTVQNDKPLVLKKGEDLGYSMECRYRGQTISLC